MKNLHRNSSKLAALACAGLVLLLAALSDARTIEWGNAVDDTLVDSHGNALDDSYVFELGSFGSFIPTENNIEQWSANWKVFDRAIAPSIEGWNSGAGFFSSSAFLESDTTSSESPPLPAYTFAAGEQAYIWVYNTQTLDYNLTEWALITNDSTDGSSIDDWLFPTPGGKTDLPLEWRLSLATSVPFGGLNDEQGPGNHEADPSAFELQTHVIPEPSGILLIIAAGIAAGLRRRR